MSAPRKAATLTKSITLTLATLAILTLTASAAHASVCPGGCGLIGEFGNGIISEPGAVAVNQSTGDVYVVDLKGQRVLEYTPTGELLLMFGKAVNQTQIEEPGTSEEEQDICTTASGDICTTGQSGDGPGQFSDPSGIAIDQATNDVYIGDTGNDRIQKFSSTGHYLTQIDSNANNNPTFYLPVFGSNVAVDARGDLYVLDLEEQGEVSGVGHVLQFDNTGKYTGVNYGPLTFTTEKLEGPEGIAVDEEGNLYISRRSNTVIEFSSAGQAIATLPETTGGLAGVDPRTGDVFIAEPEGRHEMVEFSAAGQKIESFGHLGLPPMRGIAYDISEGTLYVSDAESNSVLVFGLFAKPPPEEPKIQHESLSSLTQSSATLTAEVDPGGLDTTYHFQYATNEALQDAVETTPVDIGHGFGLQPASAAITVQPNTIYYYRTAAHNSFGASGSTVYGPVQSFISPTSPPTVQTGPATSVTQETATLNGTVTPGSSGPASDTEWCFQYGTNTTYNQGTAPLTAANAGQGTSPIPASIQLTHLAPDTLYHYRLLAINSLNLGALGFGTPACGAPGGTPAASTDATFTTTQIPPPSATTGPATEITPNTATLTGTINTHGTPTTLEFDLGTDTTYGARIFANASTSTEPQTYTVTIQALQPANTYHYRIVAHNPYGTTYGEDQTLTTPNIATTLNTPPTTPPLLPTPTPQFPTQPTTTTKHPTTKTKTTNKKTHHKNHNKKKKH
jgi:NHL repeat